MNMEINYKKFRESYKKHYQDIKTIADTVVTKGDTVVEMFTWIKSLRAMIIKSTIGREGPYYAVSNYEKDEYLKLFKFLMEVYGSYLKQKEDPTELLEIDYDGGVISFLENKSDISDILAIFEESFSQYKSEIKEVSKKYEESVKTFFKKIGIMPTRHKMPPLLPEDTDIRNIQMIIESGGVNYVERSLLAPILKSAFESVDSGGHIVFNERKEVLEGLIQVIESNISPDTYRLINLSNLNHPDNYLIIEKLSLP